MLDSEVLGPLVMKTGSGVGWGVRGKGEVGGGGDSTAKGTR